ncbi:MAG: hypothetical protein LBQ57_05050 [Spirochaetales bacterium]|jgi:hypothetical protein|nr:hypothetical protein [Spirochaetales bacterium]
MSFTELAAALKDRLYFYETVLKKMETAVKAGETQSIEDYSRLEARTAGEIAGLQRCVAARMTEASHAAELLREIEIAREAVLAASLRGRELLIKEKNAVAAQLQAVRKQKPRTNFQPAPPAPAVVDIKA